MPLLLPTDSLKRLPVGDDLLGGGGGGLFLFLAGLDKANS